MNFDDLIEQKLVMLREHETLPIKIYKYHRKVFYRQLFSTDERFRFARGLSLFENGQVAIRPFYKVYNYREQNAGLDWNMNDSVLAVHKLNGFMMSVSLINDQLVYSSTGTFDSDYVDMGRQYIEAQCDLNVLRNACVNHTCVFEICATEDPHIIKEKIGAYLIGYHENDMRKFPWQFQDAIKHHNHIKKLAQQMGAYSAEHFTDSFGNVLSSMDSNLTEGYMIYNLSNQNVSEFCIKMKTSYYLSTKFLGRHKLKENPNWSAIKERIDEEFYEILDKIKSDSEHFFSLDEQSRIEYIEHHFNTINDHHE